MPQAYPLLFPLFATADVEPASDQAAQVAKIIILSLLSLIAVLFCVFWGWNLTRNKEWGAPSVYQLFVGLVTDFLDTLGIGSFATTTALFRSALGLLLGGLPAAVIAAFYLNKWMLDVGVHPYVFVAAVYISATLLLAVVLMALFPRHTVLDEQLPGTLNVGHALPTIVQALIYITIVEVEMITLVTMIAASVLGAWLGASVVTRLSRWRIQVGMGVALLVAAGLVVARLQGYLPDPKKGDALGLDGAMLATALAGSFIIGALMTIGIGAYAPIMIMVSLLGMNEKTAFPIMMGSCAFLMPVASAQFIRTGRYDPRAALGLTIGGIPAVLVAAFIVTELSQEAVKWLVIVVVVYTAVSMLYSAFQGSYVSEKTQPGEEAASAKV